MGQEGLERSITLLPKAGGEGLCQKAVHARSSARSSWLDSQACFDSLLSKKFYPRILMSQPGGTRRWANVCCGSLTHLNREDELLRLTEAERHHGGRKHHFAGFSCKYYLTVGDVCKQQSQSFIQMENDFRLLTQAHVISTDKLM